MRKGRPELLAPAGSYEGVRAAVYAGADAVYVGGTRFSARAFAKNLTDEQLLSAIDELHMEEKRLYLTVNTLVKNQELDELEAYIEPLYVHGLDGVIVQDLGVLHCLKKDFPGLRLHASTQMTVTGLPGIRFLEKMGVERTVLARELSLEEISHICHGTDMEIECFIHGALCYCYSGQCLMSSILGGRSGNRGRCAQPCRLPYQVSNGFGSELNSKHSAYALSPRDICALQLIPDLVEAGVTSFKIEGRMKRAEYTAGVVSVYRKYLDLLEKEGREGFRVLREDRNLLEKIYTRSGFSEGYFHRHNGPEMMASARPDYTSGDESVLEQFRVPENAALPQRKISGTVVIRSGESAFMKVNCGDISVAVRGGQVAPALRQPLSEEKVRAQIQKTGGTPFAFERLDAEVDPGCFLPVQELNAMRREALELLAKRLLEKYRREDRKDQRNLLHMRADMKPGKQKSGRNGKKEPWIPKITASAETWEQLDALLAVDGISDIYVSSRMFGTCPSVDVLKKCAERIHSSDRNCFFLLPEIFREQEEKRYKVLPEILDDVSFDGAVVHTIDELEFLLREKEKGWNGKIRSDASLYGMNREAMSFLLTFAERSTLPLELNAKELVHMDASGCECYVYGYLPLMISAQCLDRNFKSCHHDNGTLMLTDRYHKQFLVRKDCDVCMNLIYNSAPLVLFDLRDQLEAIAPTGVRLSFTRENFKQTKKIADAAVRIFCGSEKITTEALLPEFTRGHFRRGVE